MLRHTFAATAAGIGYSELTIAGLLGHSVPGVTARYARVPDAALVSAADRIAAQIATALDGINESGNVVPMRMVCLAFLNTVRTERFDQVLALRPFLPAVTLAA